MASQTLLGGLPSSTLSFVMEEILPAHSRFIVRNGFYESDFSPFIGGAGGELDLSEDSGFPIVMPAEVRRVAGRTNVISYLVTRPLIGEGWVNMPGSTERTGKEEELHEDRVTVPISTFETFVSLGNWSRNLQVFESKFSRAEREMLAQYRRNKDWNFYALLLRNDNAACSVIDSAAYDPTGSVYYWDSATSKFSMAHLRTAQTIADVAEVTAPNANLRGHTRRRRFPVMVPSVAVTDLANDTEVELVLQQTAGSGDAGQALNQVVQTVIDFDIYGIRPRNGGTGHLGHPLWPLAIWSGAQIAAGGNGDTDGSVSYTNFAAYYDGSKNMAVGYDTTSAATDYNENQAVKANWLRDWPQSGYFTVAAHNNESPAVYGLIHCAYTGHDETTFKLVTVTDKSPWPGSSDDPWNAGTETVEIELGAVIASPCGYGIVLGAASIIYAPYPGESPSYHYQEHDYDTRKGVAMRVAEYFGPRQDYQGAYKGMMVLRFRLDFPSQVNGATLFAKLLAATAIGSGSSKFGYKPYLGQSGYSAVGISGDHAGTFTDPTDFNPSNTENPD